MKIDKDIRAAGSFVVIADDLFADMPKFVDGPRRLWSNSACVGVGTLVDADGVTNLQISDGEFETTLPLVFEGQITSPSGRVGVSDANLVEFGAVQVVGPSAHIRVWANDPREPDKILISIT